MSGMLKRIIYLWLLLLVATLGYAQSIQRYEYWMDSEYSKHTVVKGSVTEISFDVDVSRLDKGIHYLNFRAQNTDKDWSAISRFLYFLPDEVNPEATVSYYEYWIDDDYNAKQTKKVSSDDIAMNVDISRLPVGVHYFNFRAKNSDGVWGHLSRYLFYISEQSNEDATVADYEYWIDDNFASKQTSQVADGDIALNVDISSLSVGVHYLNFRAKNSEDVWGNLSRYLFYIPEPYSENPSITAIEYWLDDDYVSKTTQKTSSTDFYAIIDISDLESGVHYFNFRAKNSDGIWGNLSRYLVYVPSEEGETNCPIVGYRYNFNQKYSYVSISDRTEYELTDYVIDIPELTEMGSLEEGCQYTFNKDANKVLLNRTANVSFSIQFKNKLGDWSAPAASQFEMSDNLEKTLLKLPVQKSVSFEKVPLGDFQALVMNIDEYRNYFIKSDQVCSMMLYDENGALVTKLAPEKLMSTCQIGLSKGTYYGIVYNMPKDKANTSDKVTVKLMLTDNIVPTPEIAYENEMVSITCAEEGAEIYYTLDGSEPSKESLRYTAPFSLKHNAVIKAVAICADMADSDIAVMTVNSYKVQTPTIEFTNLHIYMTCATADANIFYTLDGTDPVANGQKYTDPVTVTANCTVKAVGKRDGYNHSEVATLTIDVANVKTSTPKIERDGNYLVVTSRTEGAIFYYTTDGTIPTKNSASTDRLIEPILNGTITVIAMKDGEISSDVVRFVVDWLKVETPSLVYADGLLTMSCNTPGATIYYEIGDGIPTRNSQRYTEPVVLTDNRPVKAFAVADKLNDSDVSIYNPSSFTCEKPLIAFDGYHLNITTATEGATIYYSVNGSVPGTKSSIYDGTILVHAIMTVKAIAMKPNTNSSEIATYTVPSYYDGEIADVGKAGSLSQAFDWCDNLGISQLDVRGRLNSDDMKYIKSLNALQHLDLSNSDIEGNRLADEAFAGMRLISVVIPSGITQVGRSIFKGCDQLAAIVWKPNVKLSEQALDGMENPNLLLYVNIASDAPSIVNNVIVNGVAGSIVLCDTQGNNNFYCPESFLANNISYTHKYTMLTGINECRGWETLALPFDVQRISHVNNGMIVPFGTDNGESKPFWLCKLESTGFVQTDKIEANTPYIISMPNNPAYADGYLLGGDVTFSAQNAKVYASSELKTATKGDFEFVPSFVLTEKNTSILPINVGQVFDGYPEGSSFFRDLNRSVRPFESYIYAVSNNARQFTIAEETTGISKPNATFVETLRVHDLTGQLLYSGPNLTNWREKLHLKPGIYIVNGSKIQVNRHNNIKQSE
jgi:hypothetical protein